MVEQWNNGFYSEYDLLNLKIDLIPIYDPIFQLSNIPTFQSVACLRVMDNTMIACLVPAVRDNNIAYTGPVFQFKKNVDINHAGMIRICIIMSLLKKNIEKGVKNWAVS
jgi:hypothetical protein